MTKVDEPEEPPPKSRWYSGWRSRSDGFEYEAGHEWQLYHRSWRKTHDVDALPPLKRFAIKTLIWGAFPMFAAGLVALIWFTR